MRRPLLASLAAVAIGLAADVAGGAEVAPVPVAASVTPSASENRLILTANGSTLTGASGGGGGEIAFVHTFSPGTTLGVAGDYQAIAGSHWQFGSLNGSVGFGSAADKWTLYAEGHAGSGNTGTHPFDYGVYAAGVSGTFSGRYTLQLETRQIDIDTSHGNLPKIGVAVLATRRLLASVSYARSVTGNLDTDLLTARLDHYGTTINWLAGVAGGHAAPAVVNLNTGATGPAPRLREGFVGIVRTWPRTELSLLGDYLDLSGSKRYTITLSCTLHLGSFR
jgi:hypothetical protein